MKRPTSIIGCLLLSLALGSCIYYNNEVYMVEPEAGDPPAIKFLSNLDTLSPIVMEDSLWFSFETSITGGELFFLDVYLEDQWLYDRDVDYDPDTLAGPFTLADSFWIVAGDLPDQDLLELSIFLYHSSNSNNLADLLGLEYETSEYYYELLQEGGQP